MPFIFARSTSDLTPPVGIPLRVVDYPPTAAVDCTLDGANWWPAAPLPTSVTGASTVAVVNGSSPLASSHTLIIGGDRGDGSSDAFLAVLAPSSEPQARGAAAPVAWIRIPVLGAQPQRITPILAWGTSQQRLFVGAGSVLWGSPPDPPARAPPGIDGLAVLADGSQSPPSNLTAQGRAQASSLHLSGYRSGALRDAASAILGQLDATTGTSIDLYSLIDLARWDVLPAMRAGLAAHRENGSLQLLPPHAITVERLRSVQLPGGAERVKCEANTLWAAPRFAGIGDEVLVLHQDGVVYTLLQPAVDALFTKFSAKPQERFVGSALAALPPPQTRSSFRTSSVVVNDNEEFPYILAMDSDSRRLFRGSMLDCQPANCVEGQYRGACAWSPYDAPCLQCRVCDPFEFESRPCTETSNRECKRCNQCGPGTTLIVPCGDPRFPLSYGEWTEDFCAPPSWPGRPAPLTARRSLMVGYAVAGCASVVLFLGLCLVSHASWVRAAKSLFVQSPVPAAEPQAEWGAARQARSTRASVPPPLQSGRGAVRLLLTEIRECVAPCVRVAISLSGALVTAALSGFTIQRGSGAPVAAMDVLLGQEPAESLPPRREELAVAALCLTLLTAVPVMCLTCAAALRRAHPAGGFRALLASVRLAHKGIAAWPVCAVGALSALWQPTIFGTPPRRPMWQGSGYPRREAPSSPMRTT